MPTLQLTVIQGELPSIATFHWVLWGNRKRRGFANVGYPRAVPWYTPPRTGKTHDKPREHVLPVDDVLADLIETGHVWLKADNPNRAKALEIEYGAYPDAPATVADRCKENGVKRNSVRKTAWRGRKQIERWISSRSNEMMLVGSISSHGQTTLQLR